MVIGVLVAAALILLGVGAWLAMDSGQVEVAPPPPVMTAGSGGPAAGPVANPFNRPPRAEIRLWQHRQLGHEVEFSGIFSDDPDPADVDRLRYQWDFGNGRTDDRKLGRHTFATSGPVTVTLTVTDPAGASDSASQTLTIPEYPRLVPGRQASADDRPGLVCLRVAESVRNLAELEQRLATAERVTAERVGLSAVRPRREDYGLSFRGGLVVEKPGLYVLELTSDDGSRLVLEGEDVIRMDQMQSATSQSVVRQLEAGIYTLRVDYFQGSHEDRLDLKWQPPGGSLDTIPNSAYVHREGD